MLLFYQEAFAAIEVRGEAALTEGPQVFIWALTDDTGLQRAAVAMSPAGPLGGWNVLVQWIERAPA